MALKRRVWLDLTPTDRSILSWARTQEKDPFCRFAKRDSPDRVAVLIEDTSHRPEISLRLGPEK